MLDSVLQYVSDALAGPGRPASRLVNKIAVNYVLSKTRTRPHPWSTRENYITWSGLTDRRYNARHLQAKQFESLPDIEEVVKLFKPRESKQRRCKKSTCLFPAFAQYLTDGFIRTVVRDAETGDESIGVRRRTTSNHDIDMSPLYGRTEKQTNALRWRDEALEKRGKLRSEFDDGEEYPPRLFESDGETLNPDFVDEKGKEILDPPLGLGHAGSEQRKTLFAVGGDRTNATPYVAMINTLFLREHNRIAGLLGEEYKDWNDERIFQTTRNIIIVLFIKIVVEEYINHINGTVVRFATHPSIAWNADWNKPNWITTEFSLLYRWHSLIPQEISWGGKDIDGSKLILNNGPLLASGLADAFVDISANTATQLGLHNSANFLIGVEKSALEQARFLQVDSYNAYRKAFGFPEKSSFDDIAGHDEHLPGELKDLYGTPANLEFYVGLFAEPVDPNGPLPELLARMVAVDAFSQALTNPLLSEHVWGDKDNQRLAFTEVGIGIIEKTHTLHDILKRCSNVKEGSFVGMTLKGWKRK